jgi:hypothetical protein
MVLAVFAALPQPAEIRVFAEQVQRSACRFTRKGSLRYHSTSGSKDRTCRSKASMSSCVLGELIQDIAGDENLGRPAIASNNSPRLFASQGFGSPSALECCLSQPWCLAVRPSRDGGRNGREWDLLCLYRRKCGSHECGWC